jgi:hypothetical protein
MLWVREVNAIHLPCPPAPAPTAGRWLLRAALAKPKIHSETSSSATSSGEGPTSVLCRGSASRRMSFTRPLRGSEHIRFKGGTSRKGCLWFQSFA